MGREGVYRGMLLRGDPDASPTPDKVHAQHINTCVPPPPAACLLLPPTPMPSKGLFINDFLIVARSLNVRSLCWCGRPSCSGGRHVKGEHVKDAAIANFRGKQKQNTAARGDPDASPPQRLPLGDT